MFPNPQDALPLPVHPNLERYKKLAKDLAKVANDVEPTVLRAWITNWIQTLVRLANLTLDGQLPVEIDRWINELDEFIRREKSSSKHLSLTKAQFILARSHGFDSWPKFAKQVESLQHGDTTAANFERAVEAIVTGDIGTLEAALREDPDLVSVRSAREHHANLLHYVSANGIEGYRQKTPKNIVLIAIMLIDAGADINATADVYGGGATTLMLTATSLHPEQAGVQEELLDLLLQRGALINKTDDRGMNIVNSAMANGRIRAAEFLARRGATVDLEAAAGLGLIGKVESTFDEKGNLIPPATPLQMERGLLWACEYGRNDVVKFLLARGASVHTDAGTGMSALHCAVLGAQLETMKLLLARGADPEMLNCYDGTALEQALWCAFHNDQVDYIPVVERLLKSGAKVADGTLPWVAKQKASPGLKHRLAELLGSRG